MTNDEIASLIEVHDYLVAASEGYRDRARVLRERRQVAQAMRAEGASAGTDSARAVIDSRIAAAIGARLGCEIDATGTEIKAGARMLGITLPDCVSHA